MGWKRVKEHYRIEYIVQVSSKGLHIGSSYIPNLIEVGFDGQIAERCTALSNENLTRYQTEIEADPETFRRLMQEEDVFSASLPVYTFRDAEVIEARCEEPGYPNVTHDGKLMYANKYSVDKATVVGWAKNEAAVGIKYAHKFIEKAERDLLRHQAELAKLRTIQAELDATYPDVATRGYGETAPQASEASGETLSSGEGAEL